MVPATRSGSLQRPRRASRRRRGRRVGHRRSGPLEALRPLRGLSVRHRSRSNLGRPHVRGRPPSGRRRSDCSLDARSAHRCRRRHTGTGRLRESRRRAVAGGSLGALRLSGLGLGQCPARLRLDRGRGTTRDGLHSSRRGRLLHCRYRRRRGNRERRQEQERVDVPLFITRRTHTEVDVRLAGLGGPARAYGSDDTAFVDARSAHYSDRPQVDERRRVAERCLNRHSLATGRHGSGEGDDTVCRCKHRAPARGAEVDASVLTGRVGVRVVEREGPQNRSDDRPRPCGRIRDGKRACADEQDNESPHEDPPCCQF
jgi:hypothetical protein